MEEAHFNPATYTITDNLTGEIVNIQLFIERSSKDYWEKAFAKTLAEYIGLGGSSASRILAYLIKNKDSKNLVGGTVRSIAEDCKVSTSAVVKLFKVLQTKQFLRKVRSGTYMISPEMMRHGSKTQGAMLLRIWDQ